MGALKACACLLWLGLAQPTWGADASAPVLGGLLRPGGSLLARPGAALDLLLRWSVSEPESLSITATVSVTRPDGSAMLVGALWTADPGGGPGAWLLDAGPAVAETVQAGIYTATAVACNAVPLCSTRTSQVLFTLDQDPAEPWVLAPQPLACPGSWLRFERGRYLGLDAELRTRRGVLVGRWSADAPALDAGRLWIGCEALAPGAYLLRVRRQDSQGAHWGLNKVVVKP